MNVEAQCLVRDRLRARNQRASSFLVAAGVLLGVFLLGLWGQNRFGFAVWIPMVPGVGALVCGVVGCFLGTTFGRIECPACAKRLKQTEASRRYGQEIVLFCPSCGEEYRTRAVMAD